LNPGWQCGDHGPGGTVNGVDIEAPPIWEGHNSWRMETNKK